MNIKEIKDIIDKAREERMAAYFPNMLPNVPKWDQFINHLDYEFHNPPECMPSGEFHTTYNGVVTKEGFYFHARDVVNQGEYKFFPEAKEAVSIFSEVYNEPTNGGATFLNIVGDEMQVDLHEDAEDSVFWQCQGDTEWEVFARGNNMSAIQKFHLFPGDVLVIPTEVPHRVIPSVARASIAFRYNRNK